MKGLGLKVLCAALAVWLVLPTLVVFPLAFTDSRSFVFPPASFSTMWFENFFTSADWMTTTRNSIIISLVSALVATVVGTAAALGARMLPAAARFVITGIALLPIIVPGVLIAIADYFVFLRLGLVGTYPGFVIADSVLGFPLVYLTATASLASFDRRLELAAASLGAGRWATFRTVTLPLILPGVLAGAAFALFTAWDEVLIAIFVSSPQVTTLPVRLFQSVNMSTDPTMAAVSALTIALIVVIVLAVAVRRRIRVGSKPDEL